MSKMRVYEYAKQNNLTSKAVIQSLKELNIEVSNHMSTISIDTKSKLDEKFNHKQSSNTKKQEQTKPQSSSKNEQNKDSNQQPNKGNNKNKKKQHKKQQKGKKGKNNKKNADQPPEVKATPKEIVYSGTLSVSDLAEKLNKDTSEIIKKLMFLGVMATKNQDLDDDAIELICDEFGVEVKKEIVLEDTDLEKYK